MPGQDSLPSDATSERHQQQYQSWTFLDDGEPDSEYPEVEQGVKGVRLEKLTVLKAEGDLNNYEEWEADNRGAFEGDPNRFTTGAKRICGSTR